jgi:UDP-galactopyranose mutase
VNRLYNLSLTSAELEDYFTSKAEKITDIRTSEDVVVSRVGRDLYEKFFPGYTRKQWGLDPSELDKPVTARVPVRTNCDDRYFEEAYQFMPAAGYTRLFERLVSDRRIKIMLQTDWKDIHRSDSPSVLSLAVKSMSISISAWESCLGSLRFEHVTEDCEWHQPVAVVNHPQLEPYTRVTEYKHLTGQVHSKTGLTYEYPSTDGDPYYPVPQAASQRLYKKYEALAAATSGVHFVGRLATYRYYNMDQVVGQALATFRRLDEQAREGQLEIC